MILWKLWVRLGLLYAMLLPVLGLAITMPTLPHILLAALFLMLVGYMTRAGIRLYRGREQ